MTGQVVQRKGFKRVIKTHKDLPMFVVDFSDGNIKTDVILSVRFEKFRPLLGIRKAEIVKTEDERPWFRYFLEEFYPVSIDEALSIADGSLVPLEYNKEMNSFKHWEGSLGRTEPDWARGLIIKRLLKLDHDKKPTKKQSDLLVECHIWTHANWFYQSFKHFKV